MKEQLGVKEIWQVDKQTLGIVWTDSSENRYDVVALRKSCPCAVCVDETTGQRNQALMDDISDKVRPVTIQSTGQYAMTIAFSDGHGSGIFTFDYLKSLGSK